MNKCLSNIRKYQLVSHLIAGSVAHFCNPATGELGVVAGLRKGVLLDYFLC